METPTQNPTPPPGGQPYQVPPPVPPPFSGPRRLYRSRRNRMIGGVAGGLAEYLGVDPSLIRLIWAFSIFFAGFGIFAYIVAWILIPDEPSH
jgi:phage shock protein C